MKKKSSIILLVILSFSFMITLCTSFLNCSKEKLYSYKEVKDIVIRFHVLANSDTNEDQNLKLKVRDAVINYLNPYLKDVEDKEESRRIIEDNQERVMEIAKEVIKNEGYNYDVTTEFGYENFPEKSYGNITLPQGNYEAFRVIIGKGEGHNWWCVMFPSLCFIDVSKGEVEQKESKDKLDKAVEEGKNEEVEIKFKFLEFIEKFLD